MPLPSKANITQEPLLTGSEHRQLLDYETRLYDLLNEAILPKDYQMLILDNLEHPRLFYALKHNRTIRKSIQISIRLEPLRFYKVHKVIQKLRESGKMEVCEKDFHGYRDLITMVIDKLYDELFMLEPVE